METIETALKKAAKDLFVSNKIDLLIGYTKGTLPLRSRPCVIKSADEVDKLVWNSYCSNNLGVYLPQFFQAQPQKKKDEPPLKIGIVAKGCDSRSIVGLLKEKQFSRENIVIVGVPCHGMVDLIKIETLLNGDILISGEERSDGILSIMTREGKEKDIVFDDVIMDACLECRLPSPKDTDVLIEGEPRKPGEETFALVEKFEALSPEERWQYFQEEISKCIRCYACRQVCPNCYCKECFADHTKPRWIGASIDLSDVMFYHIGRIFHQAGRCVGCGACVRACPMNIDLRIFTQKLVKDTRDLFGYIPGMSLEELPPLCTFKEDDSQDFITEP